MNVTSKVRRKRKRCTFPECTKNARDASDFCKAHNGGKRCTFPECTKSAVEGATCFCRAHGGGKRCTFSECTKGAERATAFCVAHGGGKRCIFLECTKSARGATDFCNAHGGGKRCIFPKCTKCARLPTYFCNAHGGGNRCTFLNCMTITAGATDFCILHGGGKRCTFSKCTKGAIGFTNFCKSHGGGKRCTFLECTKSSQGATAFCSAHGGGKRCPNCIDWIDSHGANKKFNGFCARCYCRLFPNDPRVRRNNKTKEGAVLCHVKQCFPELTIVNDRRINGGCSAKRPDIFIDLLTHVIIIEVDENAHITYDQSCENKRMMELSEDVAHRPLVFIRLNPDQNNDGPSCWGVDGNGLAVVKKKQAAEWQKRLAALTAAISFWKNTIPEKTVELIKLFY